MKNFFGTVTLLSTLLAAGSASAASNVSVNIDGIQYSCTAGGGALPGQPAQPGANLCRCQVTMYGTNDYDYKLQKYNRVTQTFADLENFNRADSNQGVEDRAACENARQTDPRCFFE